MHTIDPARTAPLNRRSALGGIGVVAALGLSGLRTTVAQEADLATHPLTGVWMAMANPPLPDEPQYAGPSIFSADGLVVLSSPVTQKGMQGVEFASDLIGVWEADSERRGHFTATQSITAADGTFIGTVTVDGYPEVSEDGLTFIDDGHLVMVTIRDASGAIINQIMPTGEPIPRPVTGIRMAVGAPGFPDMSGDATPTS